MLLVGATAFVHPAPACADAGVAYAQAEPAPEGYEPPPNLSMSPDPTTYTEPRPVLQEGPWLIQLDPRLVIALAQPLGLPRIGFGFGGSIGRALVVRGHFRFGLGISFAYERVQHDLADAEDGSLHQQYLSQTSFSADLRFDGFVHDGLVRPWFTIGPGLSIGDYGAPATQDDPQISKLGVTGVVRIALGIGFRIWHTIELGPRAELTTTFGGPAVGVEKASAFTPGNFSLGVDLGFRL